MMRKSMIRRWATLALFVPAFAALAVTQLGCGTTQNMTSGPGVPASEGTVNATKGSSGNTDVSVRVKHLALPSRVAPGAKIYVVWIRPLDGAPQSIGALSVDSDLEGRLDTVTPHRQFQLTVTPEANAMVAAPTNDAVFMANVSRAE